MHRCMCILIQWLSTPHPPKIRYEISDTFENQLCLGIQEIQYHPPIQGQNYNSQI